METFTASDLNFSNRAIAHFNKVLKDRGRGEGVRLGIKKAGCSGYEYTFNFVDEVLDNYIAFEKNGCKIFVDSNSFSFLNGSLID